MLAIREYFWSAWPADSGSTPTRPPDTFQSFQQHALQFKCLIWGTATILAQILMHKK